MTKQDHNPHKLAAAHHTLEPSQWRWAIYEANLEE
jgi:hypothetical protein